jgi:hypothetical protein
VTTHEVGRVHVAENWQSEYLQFFCYILLIQLGSPESKRPDEIGRESDQQQLVGRHAHKGSPAWARAGGRRASLFSWSLGLTMGSLFPLSWLAQSIAGHSAYNSEQLGQLQGPVSWAGYVTPPSNPADQAPWPTHPEPRPPEAFPVAEP